MNAPPPQSCPGINSTDAGKANSCAGCPNQALCSSTDEDAKKAAKEKQEKDEQQLFKAIRNRLGATKHIILVISGKGGTGKSSITTTLARCLALDQEVQVGVLDLDICGPSLPRMLGVEGEQVHKAPTGWTPVYVSDNLAVISTGFLLDTLDQAVIWRGPKKDLLIRQLLTDVDWGELDYLLIDTPPGTSDEHISLLRYLTKSGLSNFDGCIMVSTPQEVSLMDVRKQYDFCKRTSLKILGVIENMSTFVCPTCKMASEVFEPSAGIGAQGMCDDYSLDLLGKIALNPIIGQACDLGKSIFDIDDQATIAGSGEGDVQHGIGNDLNSQIVASMIELKDALIAKLTK